MALHFPHKKESRFLFCSFSASFVCIAEQLTSSSVFSLSLTVASKLYGVSLTKLDKVSSGFSSFKSELDKLDVDKLLPVPVDSSKLSDVAKTEKRYKDLI